MRGKSKTGQEYKGIGWKGARVFGGKGAKAQECEGARVEGRKDVRGKRCKGVRV